MSPIFVISVNLDGFRYEHFNIFYRIEIQSVFGVVR